MRLKRGLFRKCQYLLDKFPVLVITGVRQCGKTTLAKALRPDWHYFDIEKLETRQLLSSNPGVFLKQYPTNVILDEAQLEPALFSEIKTIVDEDRETKGRFILTGSSSPLLNNQIAESLAGRAASIELGTFKANERYEKSLSPLYRLFENEEPLSQREESSWVSDILSPIKPQLTQQQIFAHWFTGGYPEPSLSEDLNFRNVWFEQYVGRYIDRDIRALFPGLNLLKYQRFIYMLANLSGQILNQSDIARAIEVSNPTVKDYLNIVTQSFVWRNLYSFERDVQKEVTKMPKGYLRDSGLLHSFLKLSSLKQLQLHPIMGKSFESFIIEEILKGIAATRLTSWSAHHYRTRAKAEIDLIIDSPLGAVPIEVKYSSQVNSKVTRTIRDFIKQHNSPFGLWINNSSHVLQLDNRLFQIPATII